MGGMGKYNHRESKIQKRVSKQRANQLLMENPEIMESPARGDPPCGACAHYEGIYGAHEVKTYQVTLKNWDVEKFYTGVELTTYTSKFREENPLKDVKKEYYSISELKLILLEMERRIDSGYV